jgi:hypothetical protein
MYLTHAGAGIGGYGLHVEFVSKQQLIIALKVRNPILALKLSQ